MSIAFEDRAGQLCDGTIVLVARERVREDDRAELRDYIAERLNGHRVIVVDRGELACVPREIADALEAALTR